MSNLLSGSSSSKSPLLQYYGVSASSENSPISTEEASIIQQSEQWTTGNEEFYKNYLDNAFDRIHRLHDRLDRTSDAVDRVRIQRHLTRVSNVLDDTLRECERERPKNTEAITEEDVDKLWEYPLGIIPSGVAKVTSAYRLYPKLVKDRYGWPPHDGTIDWTDVDLQATHAAVLHMLGMTLNLNNNPLTFQYDKAGLILPYGPDASDRFDSLPAESKEPTYTVLLNSDMLLQVLEEDKQLRDMNHIRRSECEQNGTLRPSLYMEMYHPDIPPFYLTGTKRCQSDIVSNFLRLVRDVTRKEDGTPSSITLHECEDTILFYLNESVKKVRQLVATELGHIRLVPIYEDDCTNDGPGFPQIWIDHQGKVIRGADFRDIVFGPCETCETRNKWFSTPESTVLVRTGDIHLDYLVQSFREVRIINVFCGTCQKDPPQCYKCVHPPSACEQTSKHKQSSRKQPSRKAKRNNKKK